MPASFFKVGEDTFFVRHSEIRSGNRTILFIHGLGETSFCFFEAFSRLASLGYNLIAPDNIGYGHSSSASNGSYSVADQIRRLNALVSHLGIGPVILVGHSLGGMTTSYWASMDQVGLITKLVNIEGNLTPSDVTFSRKAVEAYAFVRENLAAWSVWLREEFMEKMILEQFGPDWESCRRYYGALWTCRPEAFLENAQELYRDSQPNENGECEVGSRYGALQIPKVYCSGSISLSAETKEFLAARGMEHRCFEKAFHWPMIEQADEFYRFLATYVS